MFLFCIRLGVEVEGAVYADFVKIKDGKDDDDDANRALLSSFNPNHPCNSKTSKNTKHPKTIDLLIKNPCIFCQKMQVLPALHAYPSPFSA